jgi:hypothetical protein
LRLAPRSGIDSDQASAVVIQRTDENTTVVSAARVRHAANDWSELTIDIEAYPNSGVADFGIAAAAVLRFKFGDNARRASGPLGARRTDVSRLPFWITSESQRTAEFTWYAP